MKGFLDGGNLKLQRGGGWCECRCPFYERACSMRCPHLDDSEVGMIRLTCGGTDVVIERTDHEKAENIRMGSLLAVLEEWSKHTPEEPPQIIEFLFKNTPLNIRRILLDAVFVRNDLVTYRKSEEHKHIFEITLNLPYNGWMEDAYRTKANDNAK